MDSDFDDPSTSLVAQCCDCGCSCSAFTSRSFLETELRSVKRKLDEHEEGDSKFVVPGLSLPQNARVGMENECEALREMVSNQQESIQDLSVELEEERNAAASAANETMSMILRLQREKAEIQMEARQFKRFAEEKMEHDQQELVALEDFLYKREEAIQSLSFEVQMCKHEMMSLGVPEAEADGERDKDGFMSRNLGITDNLDGQSELLTCDYPSLRCNLTENQVSSEVDNEAMDTEKYASAENLHSFDQLKDLEYRINQLERSPRENQLGGEFICNKSVHEKVIVGQSPRQAEHRRKFSADSSNLCSIDTERYADFTKGYLRLGGNRMTDSSCPEEDFCNLRKGDDASDAGDDMSDRVYTIDSVHPDATPKYGIAETKASVGLSGDYVITPKDSLANSAASDADIQKLYARLHALEADRESMRQAIISMRTEKPELVLLKEIAQEYFKQRPMSPTLPMGKPSFIWSFPFMSVFKWIASIVFWRKKASNCKYMIGLSTNKAGLRMLVDKRQNIRQERYLSRTQV